VIRFTRVSFTYPGSDRPVLHDVDLGIAPGELALVIGPTGAGKSTFLRSVNGLVPRFTGGTLSGRVVTAGRDTAELAVRELADVVGYVAQDPASGFVTETVESELAYTMEQLGLEPQVMRKRVEEVLDLLGLAALRARRLADLSGGEAQRVAIGSVLTAHPPVMVMDEPTSALDPTAAEEVLASITRLVHDLGTTVVMVEHRLERVVQYADSVIHLDRAGRATKGEPAVMMETSTVAPPVVDLGRLVGWSPLPLTVRDARLHTVELRDQLTVPPNGDRLPPSENALLVVDDLSVTYGPVVGVRRASLTIGPGEVVALMGRNGSGKSSLLWAVQGSGRRSGGTVRVDGRDPADLDSAEARRLVTLVPHSPGDLLFMETVDDECRRADIAAGTPAGTCRDLVERLLGPLDFDLHPSDLSEGQKLGLALAIQLASRPAIVLLDEPTRGLDYAAKRRLGGILVDLATSGAGIVVATHDVEFVAEVSDRVVVMAEGEIVADGATAAVVVSSPTFAPQVAKILAGPWLTVADVAAAMEPA
jgi:energy-coupling factor transporter ATP-binding protein EcfA2